MPPPSSLTDATAIVTHRCHRHRHSPMPPPSSLSDATAIVSSLSDATAIVTRAFFLRPRRSHQIFNINPIRFATFFLRLYKLFLFVFYPLHILFIFGFIVL
jgi:hypothetical protein